MMKKVCRILLLLLVAFPVASFGILGCGKTEPDIPKGDFDAAAVKAIEDEAAAAGAGDEAVSGEAGPDGEPAAAPGEP